MGWVGLGWFGLVGRSVVVVTQGWRRRRAEERVQSQYADGMPRRRQPLANCNVRQRSMAEVRRCAALASLHVAVGRDGIAGFLSVGTGRVARAVGSIEVDSVHPLW